MEPAEGVSESPTSDTTLPLPEAERLWAAVSDLIAKDLEVLSPDEIVDLALEVPALLPPDLRLRIIEFRRRAPNGDVLLLHGLIPPGVEFPPTATAPYAPVSGSAHTAMLLLTGVMTLFGEPFTYSSLYKGRIVQSMVPVPGKEFTQTSQSSTGMLDWHVEDGFREDRCDYAGLLCLRGDPAGASQYAQARDLQLAPELMSTLRQTRFHVKPDPAHVLPDDVARRQIAVLTGPEGSPEIVYDTHHISPIDDADIEAAVALQELHAGLDEVRIRHVMSPGDLLIFDNKRVVHARTPFTARFDGTDRWLMRVMVCGSTVAYRRWGRRVPD